MRAVVFVRGFAVLALLLFMAFAALVHSDSYFVQYGRQNGVSWNLKMVDTLDETAARAHPGGAILWLVGSSMLRDSFDVKVLNAELVERGSRFRAHKFGQTRGASGISRGVLARLPLAEGDVVLHGIGVGNARREWLGYVDLPDWWLMMMLDAEQIWQIREWSVQNKVEALAARPRAFFAYQGESIRGMNRWLYSWLYKGRAPKRPSGRNHTRFMRPGKKGRLETDELETEAIVHRFMGLDDLDLSPEQFNVQGLEDFRRITAEAGAELVLFEHTGRIAFQEKLVSAEVLARWDDWLDSQPELYRFPQPPENGFYDMQHPGPRGRAMLTAYLADWLDTRWRVPPIDWVKIRRQAQKPPPPVLPSSHQEATDHER